MLISPTPHTPPLSQQNAQGAKTNLDNIRQELKMT
jgi:hypothetical protein